VVPVHSANHTFQQAIAALNARQFADAERLFRRVLRSQPNHAGALNLLTVVLMNKGRFSEAETFIARAVALGGASDVSHYNYGLILKQLNRPAEALQQFSQAAAINPTVPETFNTAEPYSMLSGSTRTRFPISIARSLSIQNRQPLIATEANRSPR
jgi:Tfp pilus assembly protein PilF